MLRKLLSLGMSLGLLVLPAAGSKVEDDAERALAGLFQEFDLQEWAGKNPDGELYRLTVLRSFDPPLQFLLVRNKQEHALEIKKVRRESHGPEYRYTKLIRDSRVSLRPGETKAFADLLDAAQFWAIPTEDGRRQGLDGSGWTLEGARNGKYHKVVRDNPFLDVKTFEQIEKLSSQGSFAPLTPGQAYREGLLAAAFAYLWTLSGEADEELY